MSASTHASHMPFSHLEIYPDPFQDSRCSGTTASTKHCDVQAVRDFRDSRSEPIPPSLPARGEAVPALGVGGYWVMVAQISKILKVLDISALFEMFVPADLKPRKETHFIMAGKGGPAFLDVGNKTLDNNNTLC